MIGFTLNSTKSTFFDRQAVLNATTNAERQVLSRAGAFIRKRAQSLIKNAPNVSVQTGQILRGRKRKGVAYRAATSKPGSPPYSHSGQLRRYILFSYETQRRSVIVGPTRLNQIGNAPESLEKGGPTQILMGSRRARRRKRVTIAARPFMGPALMAELPKISQLWRDSIK